MSNNDMPGAAFVGTIHEFRVKGTSQIEGWPPYDYTFRSPDRAEAAANAWVTANSPTFLSAVANISISHREIGFFEWEKPWDLTEFSAYIDRHNNQPAEPAT